MLVSTIEGLRRCYLESTSDDFQFFLWGCHLWVLYYRFFHSLRALNIKPSVEVPECPKYAKILAKLKDFRQDDDSACLQAGYAHIPPSSEPIPSLYHLILFFLTISILSTTTTCAHCVIDMSSIESFEIHYRSNKKILLNWD